jgi:pantoate--beta-alanine ligase
LFVIRTLKEKKKMILCQDVAKLRELVANFKKENKSIGLVPTMGALHEGHASLINASEKENDITIVSVFVNPAQFGPNEDYEAYPRTLENDCIVAQNAGADVVFAPKNKDLYPNEDMTWVEVTGDITKVLCGRTRPIHFRGVTTVVSKLFNLSRADRAYFGLKDAQQTEVLRRMVDDLFFNIELRIMPIVREADGLAKSSRNTYLSPEERKSALILSKSLKLAKEAFTNGQRDVEAILNLVKDTIQTEKTSQIDYVEMYKLPGLKPVGNKIEGRVLLALAVKFGTTRLIDNVILEDK